MHAVLALAQTEHFGAWRSHRFLPSLQRWHAGNVEGVSSSAMSRATPMVFTMIQEEEREVHQAMMRFLGRCRAASAASAEVHALTFSTLHHIIYHHVLSTSEPEVTRWPLSGIQRARAALCG